MDFGGNNIVSLKSSRAVLDPTFDVQVGDAAEHRWLHQLGFSSMVMQSSSKGYKLDKEYFDKLAEGTHRRGILHCALVTAGKH